MLFLREVVPLLKGAPPPSSKPHLHFGGPYPMEVMADLREDCPFKREPCPLVGHTPMKQAAPVAMPLLREAMYL